MNNPYHDSDEDFKLKRSVFTFMDILGYSELIKHNQTNEELNRFHKAMTDGRNWLEEKFLESSRIWPSDRKNDYASKAYTDNIVIGWPIRRDGESEFGYAFSKLASFQMQMVLSGYFIRGAISIGDAFIDEIAVFGPALADAYEGEAKLARDPRIILTDSALQTVKQHLEYYENKSWSPQNYHLLCDSDGKWFLNYLEVLVPDFEVAFPDELEKHKEVVERNLTQYSNDPKVWVKYAWVARYHNFFVKKYDEFFDESQLIDVEKYGASIKRIIDQ